MPDPRPDGDDPAPLTPPQGGAPGSANAPLPRPFPPQSWAVRLAELRAQLPASPLRWVTSLAAVLALLAAGWWFLRPPPPAAEKSLPMASRSDAVRSAGSGAAGPAPAAGMGASGSRSSSPTTATASPVTVEIMVHAAGAVLRPGVYRLAMGARVTDLLTSAGGLTTDADGDRINLAASVQDGERVYVPHRGEDAVPAVVGDPGSSGSATSGASPGRVGAPAQADGGTGAPPGPVDLNTATAEQLDTLPGVGPSTAQAILEYRQQHGRFESVDELLDVRGIGDAKLAQLRDRVRVR